MFPMSTVFNAIEVYYMHIPLFSSVFACRQALSFKSDIEMESLPRVNPPYGHSQDTCVNVLCETFAAMDKSDAAGAVEEETPTPPQKPMATDTDIYAAKNNVKPAAPENDNTQRENLAPPGKSTAEPVNDIDTNMILQDISAGPSQQETAKSPPNLHIPTPAASGVLRRDATLHPKIASTDPLLHVSENPDTGPPVDQGEPQVNPTSANNQVVPDVEETPDPHSSSSMDVEFEVPSEHNTILPSSETPHSQDETTECLWKRKRVPEVSFGERKIRH
jgi:hypothetical protein